MAFLLCGGSSQARQAARLLLLAVIDCSGTHQVSHCLNTSRKSMNTFPPERIVANSSPKTSPTQTVCSRARNQTPMCSSQSAVSSTKPGFEQKDDSTVPSASPSCLGTALPFKLPFFHAFPFGTCQAVPLSLLRDPVSVSHPLAGTALLAALVFSGAQSGTELSKPLYGIPRNTRHIKNLNTRTQRCS